MILNILFLSFISDSSVNPTRALTLVLLPETFDNLWLHWSASFVEPLIVVFPFWGKFQAQRGQIRNNNDRILD